MQKVIYIYLIAIFTLNTYAKNVNHNDKALESLKSKRTVDDKNKKTFKQNPTSTMLNEQLSDYETCGDAITDRSDENYYLFRARIKRGKREGEPTFVPEKNNPDAECAVLVYNIKSKKVAGRVTSYCDTIDYSTGSSEPQNNHDTFLKGSILGKPPEFVPDFYYRVIDGKFSKAGCIIHAHVHSHHEDEKQNEHTQQYLAFENQKGGCTLSQYGTKNEQLAKAASNKDKSLEETPFRSVTESATEEAAPW